MEKSIFQIPLKVFQRCKFYRKSQYWTQNQIESYQDEKLRKLIQHAGLNVPYYRNLFKEIKLDATNFRGRQNLSKIPLLDKETVRSKKEQLIAENAKKYGITWDSTSGTTGTPLHFILDTDVQANKIAALLRSYRWAGYKLGMRTFSLQSYYFRDCDYKFNPFYNILRYDSNRLSQKSAPRVIERINKLKPSFFMGFPFDIVMLARYAGEAGLKIHPPKSIVTYGETLSDKKRKFLEYYFACKVYDFFSMHECSAMISECEYGHLHLIEDFAYHEIVEENGVSKLVGTSFYNYSMPLIRYKINDIIIPEQNEHSCLCDRKFRIVKKIVGKQCDYIETPDGRILGAVMSHSIDNAKGVMCSQIVQTSIDHIDVQLVVDDTFNNISEKNLEAGLRKRLGNSITLTFKKVPQLDKADKGGKTPFIISKIGNTYM